MIGGTAIATGLDVAAPRAAPVVIITTVHCVGTVGWGNTYIQKESAREYRLNFLNFSYSF